MDKAKRGGYRLDLEEARRLARELAARRESIYADAHDEVETMKAELRRRAEAIAERERRLTELEGRLGRNGLAEELAAAKRAVEEAESERRLAAAERERLDEREQQIRTVEKELAARRRELDRAPASRLPRRPTASVRQRELDDREAALDEREAALDEREAILRGDTMSMSLGLADGLAVLAHPDAS